jgi:hypothetical protein
MPIDYKTDLVKHFIRTDGWLPLCRRRLKTIRKTEKKNRRLRYFTFCANDAMDVLMLNLAGIVKQADETDLFDTVVFFDKTEESVVDTQKRIPGAIGFPGNFISVVLLNDPDEMADVDQALKPSEEAKEELAVMREQQKMAQRRQFIRRFPFDVVNLDLEEFLFKPKEELPGKVANALRKIFHWQKCPLVRERGAARPIGGFSLMFTTQIGPPNITNDFKQMLSGYLTRNLQDIGELREILTDRAGTDDVQGLMDDNFELFFKLAMPKMIAQALLEEDWFVDPTHGIRIYQYQRESQDGPYQMLNLVMDVCRQQPPRESRAPGDNLTQTAAQAYRTIVTKLFAEAEVRVSLDNLIEAPLKESLEKIACRRKELCPDED